MMKCTHCGSPLRYLGATNCENDNSPHKLEPVERTVKLYACVSCGGLFVDENTRKNLEFEEWEENENRKISITNLSAKTDKRNRKHLTPNEYRGLMKIAKETGMDSWFSIEQRDNGDFVYDRENNKLISLRRGLNLLCEGMSERIEDYPLTDEEKKAVAVLFDLLGVPEKPNWKVTLSWDNGASDTEFFIHKSEAIIFASEAEEICKKHKWKIPKISYEELK